VSDITKICPVQRLVGALLVPMTNPVGKISVVNSNQNQVGMVMEMKTIGQANHELSVLDNTPKATYLFCKFCAQIAQATDWEEVLAAEEIQEASDA